MDSPSKAAQQKPSISDSTDSEDEVPLARLKKTETTDEDDQPLAALRDRSKLMIQLNSDNDVVSDSEFGICEVRHRKEEVWAACVTCLILLCYDHFMEDVTSCGDHGNVNLGERVDTSETEKTQEAREEPRHKRENHETGERQGTNKDDEPMVSPRARSPLVIEFNSDCESLYTSDADPEFNPGVCEIRSCKEGVWAACEECEALVCYDHFMEKVTSCEDHGKMKKKDKQRRRRKGKISQLRETVDTLTARKTQETGTEPTV